MSIRWIVILALLLGIALSVGNFRAGLSLRPAIAKPAADEAPDPARVLRALSSTSTTAPIVKPWLADLSAFSADHPGQWIVGRSRKPCLSADEAIQSARTDATNAIGDLLRTTLADFHGDGDWMASHIRNDIEAGRLQADSCTEQFTRPYGSVWTGAVLVDASPKTLEPLIKRYESEVHATHARTLRIRFSAAAVVTLSWLLYVVLNAMTRGYFTTRLRFITLAVTVLAIMLVISSSHIV